MNKYILALFLLACVGCAMAGYGDGTPGYYDPWTWYGGYDQYYNDYRNDYRRRPQPRPYRDYRGGYSGYNSYSSYNRRDRPSYW